MVKQNYVPEKGDIVFLSFSPQSGREQMGRRPAVVLSPRAYNEKVGLALFCPITSQIKGYPFEVLLEPPVKTAGVILSDQIRNLDWRSRNIEFIEKIPRPLFEVMIKKLTVLLGEI